MNRHTNRTFGFILTALLGLGAVSLSAQESLDILPGWRLYPDPQNALIYHLNDEAFRQLEARREKVASLDGRTDWEAYRDQARSALAEAIGPWPERTPLRARVLRTIEKPGYTIEHLVFESLPRYYVTASLFLPAGASPGDGLPAILYCSGHSALGYRSEVYQHVILNLVHKGFIVFAFDPVGQGERLQYLDPETGQSAVGGPTKEHSYPGAQHYAVGGDITRYMVWDGIRAVDYLRSRPEVDPDRIGITGRSGGGTQTAQIAAFDDRILAAAPENFITSTQRLLQTRGPQDAEQFFRGQVVRGLDHTELLLARAPRPTLLITTTNDMFSIQGARETEAEVARAYAAFGHREHFSLVEDLAGHASTRKNREAMYAFFQQHLDHPGSSADEEVDLPSPGELRVTPTGQVATSFGGETLHSLNLDRVEKLRHGLQEARAHDPDHLENALAAARRHSGFRPPPGKEEAIYAGRIGRSDYVIDQYILSGEGEYPIPCLLLRPSEANGKAVLWIDGRGKGLLREDTLLVEQMMREGHTLVVPDLLGTGEMGPVGFSGDSHFEGVSYNAWFLGIYLDRSLVGLRAGDIIRVVHFLEDEGFDRISALASGGMAAELLHAAAFDPRLSGIALVDPLLSWFPLVENECYEPGVIPHLVPGALTAYDLPDLAASLAPRPLVLGSFGSPATAMDSQGTGEKYIREAYEKRDAAERFTILAAEGEEGWRELLRGWPR